MEHATFEITGMSCGHCVKAVDKALVTLDGVTVEQVAIGRAVVAFDPARTNPQQIADAIEDAGYQVSATH